MPHKKSTGTQKQRKIVKRLNEIACNMLFHTQIRPSVNTRSTLVQYSFNIERALNGLFSNEHRTDKLAAEKPSGAIGQGQGRHSGRYRLQSD
jgi:hypothetical protein